MDNKKQKEPNEKECLNAPKVIWDGKELDWVEPGPHRLYLRGVGLDYLVNEYYEKGWRKLLQDYKPSRKYKLALILPCSYGKPYSQSFIHYNIRKAIQDYIKKQVIHEIIVTNAGVVPRELDEYWPYTAYDWNPQYETPVIKECYTRILSKRVEGFFRKHLEYYEKIAAYLRWNSDSWKAVNRAADKLGIAIENLAPKKFSREESEKASLYGLYDDPDLVLITHSALEALRKGVGKIVGT